MRTYVVQAGDSPASIASRPDMAGCPKCTEALTKANPQKEAVRYPNGFVTFKSLYVGEVLNIPAEWSNGALDALPKEYFDNLPSPAGLSAPARAPSSILSLAPSWTPPSPDQWTPNMYGPETVPCYQGTVPTPTPGRCYCPPGSSWSQDYNKCVPCPQGSTWDPNSRRCYDSSFIVNGILQTGAVPTQVHASNPFHAPQVFTPQPQPIAHRVGVAAPQGLGPPPPPPSPKTAGIPTPSNTNGTPPANISFIPQDAYTLTVWPIPSSNSFVSSPVILLAALGFNIQNDVVNADGSHTIDAIYKGTAPYVPADGESTLIVTGLLPPGTPKGTPIFQNGAPILSPTGSSAVTLVREYDDPSSYDAVLTVAPVPGFPGGFSPKEILFSAGQPKARLNFQYQKVIVGPGGGVLGLMQVVDHGTTIQPNQLPYDVMPGDVAIFAVQPVLDNVGSLVDPLSVLTNYGFTLTPGVPTTQNPSDCSWTISASNTSGAPITVEDTMFVTPPTGNPAIKIQIGFYVKGLTVNGAVVQSAQPPPGPIPAPTMRSCRAFTLSFIPTTCMPIAGGPFDPTVGLDALGLTSFTLQPNGPDVLGQYSVDGVWELGDMFPLPPSTHLMVTDFTDNGQAKNIPMGPCASGLPYTIQPGDSLDLIVRPIGVPGQPMSNPAAILAGLGFANVAPGAAYSDCTWSFQNVIYQGQQPLQLTDPLVGIGGAAMWIVGLGVNGTTIKAANWAQLQEQSIDLVQCHSYSALFTFDTCPSLGGAPGTWDPTAAVQALLPGFKVAPGPNEYGEWAATGTWTGQSVTGLAGSGGVHFTLAIDYGVSAGCHTTCAVGTIADTKTGACVTPCSDGSAPAGGVCPQPIKGVGPTPPVTTPSTGTSTGTVVAVVGVAAAIGVGWLLLK